VGTGDGVRRDAAASEAAVVNAVMVVEGEVTLELAPQAPEAWIQVAREGRTPTLLEDQPLQGLEVAIGLRAAGVDVGDACA